MTATMETPMKSNDIRCDTRFTAMALAAIALATICLLGGCSPLLPPPPPPDNIYLLEARMPAASTQAGTGAPSTGSLPP